MSDDSGCAEFKGLRTCSKSFWRLHWSAIGMSGSSGCAAWARAHASSRGVKAPSSSARFHSNPAGKCLAGRSAALRRLLIVELSTAHRALHPIPVRYLCNSKKTLNRFLGKPRLLSPAALQYFMKNGARRVRGAFLPGWRVGATLRAAQAIAGNAQGGPLARSSRSAKSPLAWVSLMRTGR